MAWHCPSARPSFRKHSCTLHNTVTGKNIFMQIYRNNYVIGKDDAQKNDCSFFLSFQVMPL